MPVYDNNGTASTEIRYIYDNNGSVNTQIGKVYDNNGTTSSLIYSAETQIYPGPSATTRKYQGYTDTGTFYAIANPHPYNTNCATSYIYIGANPYSSIVMTFKLTSVPVYGWLFCGIGDFPTFNLTGLGPSISIGYSNIQTKGGYQSGQTLTVTCTGTQAAGNYIGVAAVYRSSAGTGGRIDVVSIIAQ